MRNRIGRKGFTRTRSWLLSMGLHGLLLAAAALVLIDRLVPIEDEPSLHVTASKSAPPAIDIGRREEPRRMGIPKDDAVLRYREEPVLIHPEAGSSDHCE